MCKVYTGYCGTSEIEHGLCACTVDNPLAKARGLSLRTGAQNHALSLTCLHSLSCKLRNIYLLTTLCLISFIYFFVGPQASAQVGKSVSPVLA